MDFTPLYPHSSSSSSTVSPNGKYILTSVGDRLVVRSTTSMEVIRSWRCQHSFESTQKDNQPKKPTIGSQTSKHSGHPSIRSSSNPLTTKPRTGITSFRASTMNVVTDERKTTRLTCVSFSPNSEHVFALSRHPETSIIFVHSMNSNELTACIEVGAEGVASGERALKWGPGSDCIMVWSDWGLRITIWPLTSPQPQPLQLHHPKHGPLLGSTFSNTSRYFALICRQPGKTRDHVAICDTLAWTCVSLFDVPTDLIDVTQICWSPCDRYLALIESALFNFRVEIVTPTGVRLGAYSPPMCYVDLNGSAAQSASNGQSDSHVSRGTHMTSKERNGRKEKTDSSDETSVVDGYVGLGIRHVKWRPGGEYLAIGGWDGKVRILNDITWTPICEIDLNSKPTRQLLTEPTGWIERTRAHGIIPFDPAASSNLAAALTPDFSKPNPSIGVREMQWSSDGELLACRNDAMPLNIFIFSFRSGNMGAVSISSASSLNGTSVPLKPRVASVIQFELPVKSYEWNPARNVLVIVTASSALYLWYPTRPGPAMTSTTQPSQLSEWIDGIGIPAKVPFAPVQATWIKDGEGLLVTDKTAFCLGFIVPEELLGDRDEPSMIQEDQFSIPE
ncbi:WD40-repeat-containing domain protein [Melampsora americana]|nr:WD40-repeat-containing domain protein [Melampsora americana]